MDLKTRAALSGYDSIEDFKAYLRSSFTDWVKAVAEVQGITVDEVMERLERMRQAQQPGSEEPIADWYIMRYLETNDVLLEEGIRKAKERGAFFADVTCNWT